MPTPDLAPFQQFLAELTAASGPILRRHFWNPALAVEQKSDQTPVTEADRGAEEAMRQLINARFPAHGIVAEELGPERADAEWVWVLDPIDGTKSFIHGVPLFGTLIGLLHEGKPVLGAIHQPILDVLCVGDGQTSAANDLAQLHSPEARQRLLNAAGLVRTWGDCFGYLLVATGRADIMGDGVAHKAWDVLPLVPIIRGAGGVITDWQGGEVGDQKSCIAANPRLHRMALDLLLT
jgi:myo-inositol-1(or 4)-monophosphatase